MFAGATANAVEDAPAISVGANGTAAAQRLLAAGCTETGFEEVLLVEDAGRYRQQWFVWAEQASLCVIVATADDRITNLELRIDSHEPKDRRFTTHLPVLSVDPERGQLVLARPKFAP